MVPSSPIRFFALRKGGLECDEGGPRLAGVPLLGQDPGGRWRLRDDRELADDLARAYGFPVDASSLRAGLAVVADALQGRNLAKAQIAALLLRLPDPPAAEWAGAEEQDVLRRDLAACGLLKADGDWDAQHPRTGTPPNPGWFAAKPKASDAATEAPARARPGWPTRATVKEAMRWIEEKAAQLATREGVEVGAEALLGSNLYLDLAIALWETIASQPTNEGEQRVLAQIAANYAPPKELDELRRPPEHNALGYERHHIVEQNPSNVAKDDDLHEVLFVVSKFGRKAIDDDSNLVYVPRLKHEKITGNYNAKPVDGKPFSRFRDYVNTFDYDRQRQIGLDKLRQYGVLK